MIARAFGFQAANFWQSWAGWFMIAASKRAVQRAAPAKGGS
jgi:hypothetical protein